MRRVRMVGLALFLVFSLAFAGCGRGSSSQTAPGKEPVTLTVGIPADIDNFDPHTNQLVAYFTIRYTVFEPLVKYDKDLKVQPCLAEKWSLDGDRTWVFTIRQGVKFHDGHELTPQDVKYTIERVQDKNTGSFLQPYFENVESVAVEGRNVRITLKTPNPAFLNDLVPLAIVYREAAPNLKQQPVGTGPFKFVSWSPNERVVLEKTNDYWQPGLPKIDKLVLRPLPDPKLMVSNLEAGTVDVITEVPMPEIPRLSGNASIQLVRPSSSNKIALFEIAQKNHKAFSDPKVLQALAHALDRDSINKTVFHGMGKVIPGPFPSAVWSAQQSGGYPYDLEKARTLLKEAGWSKGLEFDLITPVGYPELEKMCVMWQASLSEIGVKANVKVQEVPQWLEAYIGRTYHITANFYPQLSADPSTYCNQILLPLVQASMPDNELVVSLMTKGATTVDEAERRATYEELQRVVLERLPVLTVCEIPVAAAAAAKVKGLEINPAGVLWFHGVSVEP
ncbi:MAG: ABC transporter substrate-binding protein [Bacillota bacterium]